MLSNDISSTHIANAKISQLKIFPSTFMVPHFQLWKFSKHREAVVDDLGFEVLDTISPSKEVEKGFHTQFETEAHEV